MAFLHHMGETIARGGIVVGAILALSVILYARCFGLLIHLFRARRHLRREYAANPDNLPHLRLLQEDLQETFERQRAVLAAMIAAAPLLGLLGTVIGMIDTFRHLASRETHDAMAGLSGGISEALIATAAGLSVAIPAVLLLYLAHRELQKGFQTFAQLEHRALAASPHHV